MKTALLVIATATISLAASVTAGTAIYKLINSGDKIECIANEFNFGCYTTLGWVLSAVGVVLFAGAVYLWERFRGD